MIGGQKTEPRPWAFEERRAAAKHDGVEVESILINKTKVCQATGQVWTADRNVSGEAGLQCTYRSLNIVPDKGGIGTG